MSKPPVSFQFNQSLTLPERMPDGVVVAKPKSKVLCWGSTPILRGGHRFSCGKRARTGMRTCYAHKNLEEQARDAEAAYEQDPRTFGGEKP